MNEVLLANLFFIITGSAVLVVGAFLCFVCYHIIKIVKMARVILKRVETSTELLVDDVHAFRDYLANGNIFGRILTGAASVISAVTTAKQPRVPSRKKKEQTTED
jgi:hypothetical protein